MTNLLRMLSAGLIALVVASTPAIGHALACGDALTTSVKLDADLQCSGGSGLLVLANDVTIDLAGHTLSGIHGDGNGIDNTLGFDRVTVKNGEIIGFRTQVRHDGGVGHVVRDMDLSGGFHNVELIGANSSKVEKSFMRTSDDGSAIFVSGDDNVVTKVVVVASGLSGVAIVGNRNTVSKNTITHAGTAGVELQALDFAGNVITGNTISDAGTNCIAVFLGAGATGNVVTKNLCEGAGEEGIYLDANGSTVAGNTVIGTTRNGIRIGGVSSGTLVLKNKVTGNHQNGIRIEGSGATVAGNLASRNGDNGITAETAGATITKNTTDANGELGIRAVAGVVDGGGNKAKNDGSGECSTVAITCK